jgi:hypothetical protein
MVKVSDDIWALLAKYLFDEAGPDECLLAEEVLRNDAQLRDFYQKMQAVYLLKESRESHKRTLLAFEKLDKRIKAKMVKAK